MSREPLKIKGKELKFPVDWEFRIVVESAKEEAARKAVAECLASHGVAADITDGLRSGGGRYQTLRAAVTLKDREMMNSLSADLAKVDGIKFLL